MQRHTDIGLPIDRYGATMPIKGNLETFYMSSLLQMLNYDRKTGKLSIKNESNEVQIFLHEGDIVFATETQKANRLGELLKNSGIISQQVLDRSLALSRKHSHGLGKTLVKEGYISLERLNAFLLKQAENTVYNVFLWETGEFEYHDMDLNLKGVVGNKLDTMNILLEASRRIDEVEILKKQIPSEEALLKIAGNTEGNEEIKLNADEWRFLSMIDGNSTVRQVFDRSGFDDFTGYKILNSLISSARVEITQPLTAEGLCHEAIGHLSRIDSRQFRDALDNLGLKRSSILRVSLSCIFREAIDENQIGAAVEKEAAKIRNSREKADLDRLRQENRMPFMKPIIELLWQSVNG